MPLKMGDIAMEIVFVTHVYAFSLPPPSPTFFFFLFSFKMKAEWWFCLRTHIKYAQIASWWFFLIFFSVSLYKTKLIYYFGAIWLMNINVNGIKMNWYCSEGCVALRTCVSLLCKKISPYYINKFHWKYANILYSNLFSARYRLQCTPTHAHRHSRTNSLEFHFFC